MSQSNAVFPTLSGFSDLLFSTRFQLPANTPVRKLPPSVVPVEALALALDDDGSDSSREQRGRKKRSEGLPLVAVSALDEIVKRSGAPDPDAMDIDEKKSDSESVSLLHLEEEEQEQEVRAPAHDPMEIVDATPKKQKKKLIMKKKKEEANDEDEDEDEEDDDDDAYELSADAPSDDDDIAADKKGMSMEEEEEEESGDADSQSSDMSIAGPDDEVELSPDDFAALRGRHIDNVGPIHVAALPENFEHASTIAGVFGRFVKTFGSINTVPNEGNIQRAVHTLATVHATAAIGDSVSSRHLRNLRTDFSTPLGSTHDLRSKMQKLISATTDLLSLSQTPALNAQLLATLTSAAD